jgi:predicted acyltransferase
MSTSAQSATDVPKPASPRLVSLDALRGFDMFWILGADALVRALSNMGDNPVTKLLAQQLSHKEWDGFAFYDLIFPLFVFMVGAAMVYSLSRTIEQEGRAMAVKRVIRRGLLLVVIGIFYSGGFSNKWPDIRLLGVLQRIGLAYMFGGLLFCFFKPKALAGICAGLLIGYWAIMTFVPIHDIQLSKDVLAPMAKEAGATNNFAFAQTVYEKTTATTTGKFAPGYNVANHFDFQYLPGKKYDTYWDPEGVISTIPAIATCLLGAFAGLLLRSSNYCDKWKLIYLFSFGLAAVIAGWLWHMQFPVVKKMWSSSFVLVAGGYSAMLLGTFYLIVDVWKYQKWCQPFIWIGMNSITIYLANNLIRFRTQADRFVGGDVKEALNHSVQGLGDMVGAMTGLALCFLFCWYLHRKKIFLRL